MREEHDIARSSPAEYSPRGVGSKEDSEEHQNSRGVAEEEGDHGSNDREAAGRDRAR